VEVARRLYLYVIAGITLALLVGGLISLFDLVLQQFVDRGDILTGSDVRQRLSSVLALVAVALPIWAIHWWLAERGVRPGAPRAAAERASAVRALYLTLVLLGLLLVILASGMQLVRFAVTWLAGTGGIGAVELGVTVASLVIAGGFWIYHIRVRLRDERTPLVGAAAWLPRGYRYLASFIGLMLLLAGVVSLVTLAGDELGRPSSQLFVASNWGLGRLAGALANIMLGLAVWAGHWWYSRAVLFGTDWRSAAEQSSRLRYAYFVLVFLVTVAVSMAYFAQALRSVLTSALSVSELSDAPEVDDLASIRSIVGLVILGVIFASIWWTHRTRLIADAARVSSAEVVAAQRLGGYTVALLGIAFAATGIARLTGLAFDVALRSQDTLLGGSTWGVELAQFLSIAVVGSIVWLLQLRAIERWRRSDPLGEARSTARRSYLLLVVAGTVIAGLGALVLLLNRLIEALLGVQAQGILASELSAPAGVLFVAIIVGALHTIWLRSDARTLAAADLAVPPETEPAPSIVALPAQRQLVLVAPAGGDVDATIDGIRSNLPEGYRLEDASEPAQS
jgi:Domain of unknown function (DUF5671)